MKKKTKIKIAIVLLSLIALHFVTYSVDSERVSSSQNPIFAVRAIPAIKDGGTAFYYGIGYQVIRWHKAERNPDRRLLGYEIHRIPFFKNYEEGPSPKIKYVDYYTHKW